MAGCTFGHAIGDGLANAVPPLWHTVRDHFRLTDPQIGLIAFLISASCNFGQPVFGYIVDRWRLRNVIPLALLVSSVFTCIIGFAPNVVLFTACLLVSGLGIALFHPRGGALAAQSSGRRRALGMSIFGAGGAIGYAVAALLSPLLHLWGLKLGLGPLQGFIFALPLGVAGVYLLWRFNPERGRSTDEADPETERFSIRRHLLPHVRPLAPLLAVMVLRSGTVTAYATFMQVLQGDLARSPLFQGLVLFSFVAGAAIGGIVGGHLSDRYGRRFITVVSLLLSPAFLVGALSSGPLGVVVLLFIAGFTLRGGESVNIAQTQDLLPQGMGMASAISMGFTWGLAGGFAWLVGMLSEATGSLSLALGATASLPVIAAIIALWLPTKAPGSEAEPELT